MTHSRYAIYYAPEPGPLAEFGATWLGWDLATGAPRQRPEVPELPMSVEDITATPHKYGFHGTIKPPFTLADGCEPADLRNAARALCAGLQTVTLDGLRVSRIGSFLALVPVGEVAPLSDLAAAVVRDLDRFRSPPSEAELERRRAHRLTDRQEQMLTQFGYPYVMDEFRFHMTLSGRLPHPEIDRIGDWLTTESEPLIPAPFVIRDLCLVGERPDGRFETLERLRLFPSNPDG